MHILVSGLINTETTAAVRGFPIHYYPIDYAFFGVNTAVSGVAFNLAKALKTLGDEVQLASMTGHDFAAAYIRDALQELDMDILEEDGSHIYTPHCCRHTFATLMKNVDAPATDKQKLIGHSKFEMTAHYTHTDIESLKKITDNL